MLFVENFEQSFGTLTQKSRMVFRLTITSLNMVMFHLDSLLHTSFIATRP
jgi:hypothetical protein